MELLVSQIYSNKYGIPETASNTTIPSAWVDGPTVRKRDTVPLPGAPLNDGIH
jgi:hypothetical protein